MKDNNIIKPFTLSECKNIVINNDIDGLLCGAFLKKVYNSNIVGMTNSKDKVLWKKDYTQDGNEIFIDFTAYGQKCIDQHIHPIRINNILNPNFERDIYAFSNYTRKFPYSCYIYVLYLAALDGKNVTPFLNPENKLLNDLIYRCDGIAKNAKLYTDNVTDWNNWMFDNLIDNPNRETFATFFKELKDFNSLYDVDNEYRRIENNLEKKYGFKKEELPFNEIQGEKLFILLKLNIKWDDFLPDNRNLSHKRTIITTMQEYKELMENHQIFSYAFIYSPYNKKGYKNFSYTEILLL